MPFILSRNYLLPAVVLLFGCAACCGQTGGAQNNVSQSRGLQTLGAQTGGLQSGVGQTHFAGVPPAAALAQEIDPGLWRVIANTQAWDNHAHPVLPPPYAGTDRGFDALPVDDMEPETDVVAWRLDNPQLPAAWRALWGFQDTGPLPLDAAGIKALAAARNQVKSQHGAGFDAWVLEQAGIAQMAANRVSMGADVVTEGTRPGPADPVLGPRHFYWVPYADALLLPLNTSALAAETPDKGLFYPLEDKLRARYLAAAGLTQVPATLDGYLRSVVTATLQRQQAAGAIAEKFEVAYLRPFGFAEVPQERAAAIYARYAGGGQPSAAEYKDLQDFLFRFIAAECGRLHMAVHLHTMSGGGGYFDIGGADPLLLEPVFNDKRLRGTRFVMLHGGWPFVREAGALLQKPNVYLDLSQQSLTFPPRTMATWLREWLETFPEKVLFGTDAYPYSDSLGWEESAYLASGNARAALGLALTGMVQDGEISRERAEVIAREVLAGNAKAIYGMTK